MCDFSSAYNKAARRSSRPECAGLKGFSSKQRITFQEVDDKGAKAIGVILAVGVP
jgi:hypothetical protein